MTAPAALIECCNEALSEIAASPIGDIAEDSVEAANCRVFAPPLLLEVAEWAEIPDAVRKVDLASTSNDRDTEWNYAYEVPADMGFPLALRVAGDPAPPLPLYGYGPVEDAMPHRFIVQGGVIFTNVEDARLIYTTSEFSAAMLRPTLRRAFVLELAARLAYPVKKDLKLKQDKRNDAEIARARAISVERNRTQTIEPDYVSRADLAREGYL